MGRIEPIKGETPLEALVRTHRADTDKFFEWDESEFVPCSPEEAREGLREAMAVAREKGWIPKDDPGCECFTCRNFRAYLARPEGA